MSVNCAATWFSKDQAFQTILHSIPETIFIFDSKGTILYVSPSCFQLLGYTPEEMTGQPFHSFICPEDTRKTARFVTKIALEGGAYRLENRYFRKDGSLLPVLWSGRWEPSDGLLYCVARDNSEHSELEHRLHKAQELARMASYEFNIEKCLYTHVSQTLYDIFGLEKNAPFSSRLFWSMVHPEDLHRVKDDVIQYHKAEQVPIEFRIIRPDGTVRWLSRHREVFFDDKNCPIRTVGTLQDITERKAGEMALQLREEWFRSLVQNCNDMFGVLDRAGNYLFVGDNVTAHLGYRPEELLGRSALSLVHPDDLEDAQAALFRVGSEAMVTVGPFRLLDSQGKWRWLETTASNHLDNPVIGGVVINSRDVTEKKLREDALKENERLFKALVMNGSDIIVVLDDAFRFSYLSDNVKAIFGYEPAELLGKYAFDYIHEQDRELVASELYHVLNNSPEAREVQHRFLHQSGQWIWLESRGSNHQDNKSIQGILVNARNIDEGRKLQDRLNRERSSRQRAITAAAIKAQEKERTLLGLELHDNVNQVLTTVKLYNELYLSGYLADKGLLVKAAGFTQDCINEIRSISKRLSAPTLGNISLLESIEELVQSVNLTRKVCIQLAAELGPSINITEDIHLAVYRIVQEALNNILKYARAEQVWVTLAEKQGKLVLQIKDNGVGFDWEGQRSGIGITNMKTRTESLNGCFKIRSSKGAGCVIRASFPLVETGS